MFRGSARFVWVIVLLAILAMAFAALDGAQRKPTPKLAWNYHEDGNEVDWYVQVQGQEKKPVRVYPSCKRDGKDYTCTTPVQPFKGKVVRVYYVNSLNRASTATDWLTVP